ncbi:lipid A biosynthesis (KDO)2-(lauroyl)-lipid IVA acyltransferase [Vibrio sp. UCD-FRSSP16_10]|uniref:lauroyl-Kdo(2)-lipid IV(A) myristoyltransferase n=1 Tax=unclassified Vibrio TaxID=2614977 RepID=UPI0007FD04BC|nr:MULTISPECIES: lauroyl-Kdo(2)-lipid IV(A) myristoyltransferase [unclassified Vibrio]OBT10097.1 lipid A biosynthesis (KDO)2-(lauroyl)-lipid IVA acyltransferase [Vibrio sp. UCD-FRSSP16_30]OBT18887.1 lipid A biosynthesis (KDO)2-(lauroyl)-lipid IVA acyltransferase [Vibrio sp. UCD-FRSSP16_10]
MKNTRNDFDPKAYNPKFKWQFLSPKYWTTWLGILFAIPFSFLPLTLHRWLSSVAAKKIMSKTRGQAHRARVNLSYCYPQMPESQREGIIFNMLTTAGSYLMRFPLLTLRSRKWLAKNTVVNGLEHFIKLKDENQSVIFLVPHTWSVDVFAMLLASKGYPICTMVKSQKNELSEWAMSKQRKHYGGRLYERSGGIKPFIKAINDGYTGYFLPDQDHGPKKSVFVKFCATTKATLPVMGFLAKATKSKVIPIWTEFNTNSGKFEIDVYPALEALPTESPEEDAIAMNQFIEQCCEDKPEQYMWNLKLLLSQKDHSYIYKNNKS